MKIDEKPNLEYIAGAQPGYKADTYALDITDLIREKSDKKLKIQDNGEYGMQLSFFDKKGHSYSFVADNQGNLVKAYVTGVKKEELKDPQSILKQYMDVLSKYIGKEGV